tara:strand:- start:68 stop:679 length:612 start_codon:yes stop_codon:yes gene_type:complete
METKININIISAYCKNNGIGLNNDLPWRFKSDLNKFKILTTGNKNNAVIMGKNTWNSLNKKSLKYRDNLILSKSMVIDYLDNNNITKSFDSYENLYKFLILKEYDEIWIIGGETIYKQFFELHCKNYLFNINKIYITYINKLYNCDTFFPKIDLNNFKFISFEIHRDYSDLNKLISINDNNNDMNSETLQNKYLLFDVLYKRI